MRIARVCGPCDEGMHEACVGTLIQLGSGDALIRCECDHDDYLAELLQQSVSQFTTVCTGARYGIMLDYHELKRLVRTMQGRIWTAAANEQVRQALEHAEADHRRHVENGTCIESPVPRNSRTKQWKEDAREG